MAAPASAQVLVRSASASPLIALRMGLGLLIMDLCALSISVLIGFQIWALVNPKIPRIHPVMALMPLCTIAAFSLSGLYPGIALTAVAYIRRLWRAITLSCLLLTAAMFLVRNWWADSRGAFFLAWLISFLLVPAARWLGKEVLSSFDWWGVPVIVIGAGRTGKSVIRTLARNQILGLRAVACVDDDLQKHGPLEGVPVCGKLSDVGGIAQQHHAPYAIVAIPSMSREKLVWHLQRWARIFPRILLIPDLAGVSSLWTEPRDLGGVLGLEIEQKLLYPWNRLLKRSLDIVVSSAGLVVTWPLLFVASILIKRVDKGSAIYRQLREGKEGREFGVIKLRTMRMDASSVLQHHLDSSPAARLEWSQFCKLKQDPRILPGIGKFLRRTSLDELPQLWNVLRGEMSLVGPRPFPTYHNEMFDPEVRKHRTQVTPGLTGLWQVVARSDGDLGTQASLDEYYVRNWSLWLDLYVLIRTVRVVITQEGSY
jgi:Undecaprenyl-phosphate galactose phosphotransferase WbaP